MRKIFIVLAILSFQQSMAQGHSFSGLLNQLFFGVDLSTPSSKILDSFKSKRQLKHFDNGVRQMNLNVSMQMGSADASSSDHKFNFTVSPLDGFRISKGTIELTLGENKAERRLLDLNWEVHFSNKGDATKFYHYLKSHFSPVSKWKKETNEQGLGLMAQFSSSETGDAPYKAITLFLENHPKSKDWTVALSFGNEHEAD